MRCAWTSARMFNFNQQQKGKKKMHRIGNTPNFGIDNDETGLFVSSVEYTPSCETYEQLDKQGEIQGLALYKQKVEVTLSGEVPYQADGTASAYHLGGTITLANTCPENRWLGGEAPTATTTVITGLPYTRNREGAQEISVTATIYPFGAAS